MSRAMNLQMREAEVRLCCTNLAVGVSVIEQLSSGGVRLVCMSSDGADRIREALKSKVIVGEVVRTRARPDRRAW